MTELGDSKYMNLHKRLADTARGAVTSAKTVCSIDPDAERN